VKTLLQYTVLKGLKLTFSFFVQEIIIIVCNICIFAPSLR